MSYEEIKQMIDEMGKANFEELNIEFPDGVKICMKKGSSANSYDTNFNSGSSYSEGTNHVTGQNTVSAQPTNEVQVDNTLSIVKSPMVGTFYGSPSPTEKAFVSVGDKVKKGQVLCIIEAMKLMNEIESEFNGEIVEVCVKNEGVVEYGSPLFKIRSEN